MGSISVQSRDSEILVGGRSKVLEKLARNA